MSAFLPLTFLAIQEHCLWYWQGHGPKQNAEAKMVYSFPVEGGASGWQSALLALAAHLASQGIKPVIDYVVWPPSSLLSLRTTGVTEIRQGTVAPYELEEVLESAKHIGLPADFELHHLEPLGYQVDQHFRSHDPIGLHGKRLEGQFHLLAVEKRNFVYLKTLAKKAGLQVKHWVPKPLTLLSHAICLQEGSQTLVVELQPNRCVLALGQGSVSHFVAMHPMGEGLLARDLAGCLGIGLAEAEKIRHEFPQSSAGHGLRRYSHGFDFTLIAEVLSARAAEMVEELFTLVQEQIRWDMPLQLVVRSEAVEPYWRPWLVRHFPQATLQFVQIKDCGDEQERLALESYVERSTKNLGAEVTGWRSWWKRCKNWIEYHL